MPIKPLEPALEFLQPRIKRSGPGMQHRSAWSDPGLRLLRWCWPCGTAGRNDRCDCRPFPSNSNARVQQALKRHRIALQDRTQQTWTILHCTGSRAPGWFEATQLPVDPTDACSRISLQVEADIPIFRQRRLCCDPIGSTTRLRGLGCTVRAALAVNLEARSLAAPPDPGARSVRPCSCLVFQDRSTSPGPERRLAAGTLPDGSVAEAAHRSAFHGGAFNSCRRWIPSIRHESMACRGCAAKLAASPLASALSDTGLSSAAQQPEDAAELLTAGTAGSTWLQSVDGFPALVSDPWRNARLTALHACSDLWASGAVVTSAQAVITVPALSSPLQSELLSQTLAGLQAALQPQGAALIGGHTLEARHPTPSPASLGMQVTLCVNGQVRRKHNSAGWSKRGLQRW